MPNLTYVVLSAKSSLTSRLPVAIQRLKCDSTTTVGPTYRFAYRQTFLEQFPVAIIEKSNQDL